VYSGTTYFLKVKRNIKGGMPDAGNGDPEEENDSEEDKLPKNEPQKTWDA
jgi:hypothetical protein